MSRHLSNTRDLSLIAGAAALVGFAWVEIRDQLPFTRPAAGRRPVEPAAPHGWLQPVSGPYGTDPVRPALRAEADAFTQARRVDPAGLVGRDYDGGLHLPGEARYGTAPRYFHVTATRDTTDSVAVSSVPADTSTGEAPWDFPGLDATAASADAGAAAAGGPVGTLLDRMDAVLGPDDAAGAEGDAERLTRDLSQ